jgi:hypothetical protein
MSTKQNLLVVAGVAVVAFVAGRMDLFSGSVAAVAQSEKPSAEQPQMQMSEEQKAWFEASQPGEHHKVLDQLLGTWEGRFKIWMDPDAEAMTSTGTMTREWIMDGRYLKEEVDATTAGGPFRGMSIMGYNNTRKIYELIWIDNQSTAVYMDRATYDPETKTLKTRGSMQDPLSGRTIMTWGEVDMSDPDRHVFTGWMHDADGRPFKNFQAVAERVKSSRD